MSKQHGVSRRFPACASLPGGHITASETKFLFLNTVSTLMKMRKRNANRCLCALYFFNNLYVADQTSKLVLEKFIIHDLGKFCLCGNLRSGGFPGEICSWKSVNFRRLLFGADTHIAVDASIDLLKWTLFFQAEILLITCDRSNAMSCRIDTDRKWQFHQNSVNRHLRPTLAVFIVNYVISRLKKHGN